MDFLLRQRLSVTAERDLQNIHFKNKDMRIKINDKIYRLKEIESGVDSLMELVEEPQFKDGDFVVNVCGISIIFKNKVGDSIYDHAFFSESDWGVIFSNTPSTISIERHATEEEKQKMLDELAKEGKMWNEEEKCIEDIPKRKFQKGDKVRIKEGVSSKTHNGVGPSFVDTMDKFIGKELTVKEYNSRGWVVFYGGGLEYEFAEDWLEPYEELRKGDLAIFWDEVPSDNVTRFYRENKGEGVRFPHVDSRGDVWRNAVKLESVEQYEKLFKGKL